MSVGAANEGRAAARSRPGDEDFGYGWMTFAGVLALVVGGLNMIYGIAAIDDSKFFVANTQYVFSDLNTWGWVLLFLGICQVLVGFGIFAKNQFSRWAGVAVFSVNAFAQLLFMPAYPFLALSLLAMDLLAIYGLLAYGGRAKQAV